MKGDPMARLIKPVALEPSEEEMHGDNSHHETAPPVLLVAKPITDFELPALNDSSVLIGNRYLSRGDGAILASTSGMGKSSLSIQLAVTWALGREFHGGLKPNGPLRSLIFQSEDSDGDIAEVRHSIVFAMKLTSEEQLQVRERVLIVTDRIHRGLSFYTELKRQVEIHKPDVVWINPLLAYIGADINDAEPVGQFLREWLNGLNEPARFAYILIHHTSKPPKEAAARRWHEVMYDMAGSADLTNWARAIISLRASEKEGTFNLVFAKRGVRAGYTRKAHGMMYPEPVTTLKLQHCKDRITVNGHNLQVIFWELDTSETSPEAQTGKGRPKSHSFADFVTIFPTDPSKAMGVRALHRAAVNIKPVGINAFYSILDEAVTDYRLTRDHTDPTSPKYYRKPSPVAVERTGS